MSFKSILRENEEPKPIYRRLKGKPDTWVEMFNISNIRYNLRTSGAIDMNGCAIRMEGTRYKCFPVDFKAPDATIMTTLPDLDHEILKALTSYQPVTFDDLPEILFYTHLELIVSFLTMDESSFAKQIASDNRFKRVFYRPKIVEPNKNALILERKPNRMISNRRCDERLKATAYSLGVRSLELPLDYDLTKTLDALTDYNTNLAAINFPDDARGFDLKFKKLGTYKANGFYSEELNIIIVDPREPRVFYHELGHLIFDHNVIVAPKISATNSEDYAQAFYAEIVGENWKAI